jgi:hypothetical protein
MHTSYTAKVYGIVWAGYKASTKYYFTHRPTRAEVLDRSGDFQKVTRIQLRATETRIYSLPLEVSNG